MVKLSIIFLYLFLLLIVRTAQKYPTIHGRYTRDVDDYQLVIPHKLTQDGKFLTFSLPNYFKHNSKRNRKKRSIEESVNYGLWLNGNYYHLELRPNHNFISPAALSEYRDPTISVRKRKVQPLSGTRVCHYLGKIRGKPNSRVAISTCDGLAGNILIDKERYYVEPLMEHGPNKRGHHLHMIYKRNINYPEHNHFCGTTSNWESEWKTRLKESYKKNGNFKNETRRGLESKQRYIEVLVVCDKKFLKFHRKIDIQTYVMTIMNMVYDYYQDASVGNQIDIAVVRIIYLEKEEEEIDLIISASGHECLKSFCDWQVTVNPKDINSPIHHDVAILFTRYDLCDEKIGNCGLMGLAYVAVPCTGNEPCSINEDSGLMLSVVATHEIGHIMGCSHDAPDESGCPETAEDKSYNIMAPAVHMDTRQWSTCSRTLITNLLENGLGECLNDEPDESDFKFANLLPGVVYDANYQCNWFEKGTVLCGPVSKKVCYRLMCTKDHKKCRGNGEPAADGTTCGENKWCIRGKCVQVGDRPEAINGDWGDWGSWSECSRTCGGGVSYQERECNNPKPAHGGRYCLGDRKKVKICNTDKCPDTGRSFRAVQCSAKDKEPVNDYLYTWKPYILDDKPCALYCINQENVYMKLEPRVKDGTKCKKGTKDMCIAGVCMKVGCDFKINSEAIEDICGVCEGDGTSCKVTNRNFRGSGSDYTKVVEIPKGVLNLEFEELAPSVNTIAIADENGRFCLNGNHEENTDQSYVCGGVEGIYNHPEPQMEKYSLYGPTKSKLVLYVVFYEIRENVGYRYKYADPSKSNPDFKPVYHWEIVGWKECSVRCGGGTEIGEASCIERKLGKVSPSRCKDIPKPEPQTRICNELPCPIKWRTGKWGKCVACKHKSGVRVREVECVRESANPRGDDVLVEDDLCPSPKPPSRELCDSGRRCLARKANDLDLPHKLIGELWYQTIVDMININPAVREDVVMNARTVKKISRDLRKRVLLRGARGTCSVHRDKTIKKIAADPINNDKTSKKTENKTTKSKSDSTKNKSKDKSAKKKNENTTTKTNDKLTGKDKAAKTDGKNKLKVKPGSIVEDRVHPNNLRIIEVDLKSVSSGNMSDEVFEKIGDQISDTLDFQHGKVITGKEAAKKLKEFNNETAADQSNL